MQKNKNRKGLALGAIFALVTSLFAAVPAQANVNSVVAFPASGGETQFTMIHGEAFDLRLQFGNNVPDGLRSPTSQFAAALGYRITKPVGVTVSVAVGAGQTNTFTPALTDTMSPTYDASIRSSQSRDILISLPGRSTVSAQVAITVTPFLDLNGNQIRDNGEEFGTPVTVTFVPFSALNASVTLEPALEGDRGVTASFRVNNPSINWAQLDNSFEVLLGSTTDNNGTAAVAGTASAAISTGPVAFAAGGYSVSKVVLASPGAQAAFTKSSTVSAQIKYGAVLFPRVDLAVASRTIDGVTFSAVVGNNLLRTGAGSSDARVNSAFSIRTNGHVTGTSSAVATSVVALSLTVDSFPAGATVTLNGTAHTSSATLPTASRELVLGAGRQTITVTTTGFSGGEVFTFTATSQQRTGTYAVTLKTPVFAASDLGSGFYATAPGTAITLNVAIKDQFGVASSRPLQRVSASAVLVGSLSAAVTAAVVDGKASFAVTPTPATRTGSATVTVAVENQNADNGLWVAQANPATITVTVTDLANGFTISPKATASASISYEIADGEYEWSNAITGSTIVAGAVVTVAGEGLVFSADGGKTTASDSLTFRTIAAGAFSVNVAGTRAGDHQVTFTAGAATAVSVLTIDPAAADAGTEIEISGPETALPNRTLTYTGSVVDEFGNPVANANLTITALGPVSLVGGSTAATTDVDGEFTFRVQTSANDEGDISVTATYNKNGAATLAKDKISAVALTTVAAPVVVTADKVTVAGAATVTTGLSTDVVVTVVDADGNALAGRNVSLRSTGPGFLNVQSAVSDTDGKVVVKFIATAQAGEVVITAVVDGKVGTHTLKVEAPVVVVPEINAVIGTFNGRWAVRVENAKGSVVSVKVGARWFQFTALNDNYMFSRASRTGATVPVAVYVNGQLENVATITIR